MLLDMSIHDFDLCRYFAGSEAESVYCTGACNLVPYIGANGDVDTAVTVINFKNGCTAVVDNSRQTGYGMERRVETFAEGQRFTDIRRWVIADQIPELDGPAEGMNWQSTVDADFFKRTKLLDHVRTWDDKWYWMPLPQSEVDKNTNLVQAPGW